MRLDHVIDEAARAGDGVQRSGTRDSNFYGAIVTCTPIFCALDTDQEFGRVFAVFTDSV